MSWVGKKYLGPFPPPTCQSCWCLPGTPRQEAMVMLCWGVSPQGHNWKDLEVRLKQMRHKQNSTEVLTVAGELGKEQKAA